MYLLSPFHAYYLILQLFEELVTFIAKKMVSLDSVRKWSSWDSNPGSWLLEPTPSVNTSCYQDFLLNLPNAGSQLPAIILVFLLCGPSSQDCPENDSKTVDWDPSPPLVFSPGLLRPPEMGGRGF